MKHDHCVWIFWMGLIIVAMECLGLLRYSDVMKLYRQAKSRDISWHKYNVVSRSSRSDSNSNDTFSSNQSLSASVVIKVEEQKPKPSQVVITQQKQDLPVPVEPIPKEETTTIINTKTPPPKQQKKKKRERALPKNKYDPSSVDKFVNAIKKDGSQPFPHPSATSLAGTHHAFLVPYRDRQYHLQEFIKFMQVYLKYQYTNGTFTLWIVEQANQEPFNRAWLGWAMLAFIKF